MRVKEIERTANVAWSPESQYPIYIVAGTAAQQLDATFRYGLNIGSFRTVALNKPSLSLSIRLIICLSTCERTSILDGIPILCPPSHPTPQPSPKK